MSYKTWISGGQGPLSDVLRDFSGNETDNNARLIFGISPTYTTGKFIATLTSNSLGARQANIPSAFRLLSFGQADLSAAYGGTSRFRLQGKVNNLFNVYGVLGWSGPGGFPAALNRQGFTKDYIAANPNAVFATQGSMPRAYFVTASYRF